MQQVKIFKQDNHNKLERDINEWLQSTGCNHEFRYKVIDIRYRCTEKYDAAFLWYTIEKRVDYAQQIVD